MKRLTSLNRNGNWPMEMIHVLSITVIDPVAVINHLITNELTRIRNFRALYHRVTLILAIELMGVIRARPTVTEPPTN